MQGNIVKTPQPCGNSNNNNNHSNNNNSQHLGIIPLKSEWICSPEEITTTTTKVMPMDKYLRAFQLRTEQKRYILEPVKCPLAKEVGPFLPLLTGGENIYEKKQQEKQRDITSGEEATPGPPLAKKKFLPRSLRTLLALCLMRGIVPHSPESQLGISCSPPPGPSPPPPPAARFARAH